MISPVERNLFLANAAGYTISALSAASLAFFGLYTCSNIAHLTATSTCIEGECELLKQIHLETLPARAAATALSALALYTSITFTRQLRAHIIQNGLDQAIPYKSL
jgi:hypothetical protein